MCNQYGSSFCVSWTGDQYSMVKMAWIVSTDLTDVAIDHLILHSAKASREGYNIRSLCVLATAHPSAQTTENRVNDNGRTISALWRIGSSRHTSGFRILKNLAGSMSHMFGTHGAGQTHRSKYLSASLSSIMRELMGSQVKKVSLRGALSGCEARTCQSF